MELYNNFKIKKEDILLLTCVDLGLHSELFRKYKNFIEKDEVLSLPF